MHSSEKPARGGGLSGLASLSRSCWAFSAHSAPPLTRGGAPLPTPTPGSRWLRALGGQGRGAPLQLRHAPGTPATPAFPDPVCRLRRSGWGRQNQLPATSLNNLDTLCSVAPDPGARPSHSTLQVPPCPPPTPWPHAEAACLHHTRRLPWRLQRRVTEAPTTLGEEKPRPQAPAARPGGSRRTTPGPGQLLPRGPSCSPCSREHVPPARAPLAQVQKLGTERGAPRPPAPTPPGHSSCWAPSRPFHLVSHSQGELALPPLPPSAPLVFP